MISMELHNHFWQLYCLRCNYGFEPIVIAPKRSKYNLICDKYGIENYSILYKRCSTLNYRKTGERILMDLNYRITNAIAIGKIVNSIDTKEVCLIHVIL